MDLIKLVDDYNKGNMILDTFINSILIELDMEGNYIATNWFVKDIKRKHKSIKPIIIKRRGNSYKFNCNNEELFKLSIKKYNNLNSNDSLLRTSLNLDDNGLTNYQISNQKFILGKNGLYELEDEDYNKYRYITFYDNGKIYYEALVDKKIGNLVIKYFDKNGDIESRYQYSFKIDKKESNDCKKTENRINTFLSSEFPNLSDLERARIYADLVDQYFYDTNLIDIVDNYKDLYMGKGSSMTYECGDNGYISGISVSGIKNKNIENYFALSHSTIPELKLLCVSDFVNGTLFDNKLSKLICLELDNWFTNLDFTLLQNEEKLVFSLSEKILNINKEIKSIIAPVNKSNKKNGINKVIGSSLGIALITKDNTYLINYGDTRMYGIKDNELVPLTVDDTKVWDLYKANEISRDDAQKIQKGSKLTNYIGNESTYLNLPDLYVIDNDSYDKLYLFSDGVTDNMSEELINNIVRYNSKKESLREIVTKSYKMQKKKDDVTGCCYIKK